MSWLQSSTDSWAVNTRPNLPLFTVHIYSTIAVSSPIHVTFLASLGGILWDTLKKLSWHIPRQGRCEAVGIYGANVVCSGLHSLYFWSVCALCTGHTTYGTQRFCVQYIRHMRLAGGANGVRRWLRLPYRFLWLRRDCFFRYHRWRPKMWCEWGLALNYKIWFTLHWRFMSRLALGTILGWFTSCKSKTFFQTQCKYLKCRFEILRISPYFTWKRVIHFWIPFAVIFLCTNL